MSLPYFPMYPADFEADTSHLSLEEDGAYNRILRLMWMTPDCTLPADDAWLTRRLRVDAATFDRVVKPLIAEFMKVVKGRLFSPRLRAEFEAAHAVHAKRSEAGKKGGRPSNALKTQEEDESRAKARPKQPEPEPEPEPLRERAKALSCDPPGFADFWAIYPRKVGKGAARTAWAKAIRGADPPTIIAAARLVEDRGEYTPHPATWLNAERWLDEEPRNERNHPQQPKRPGGGQSLLDAAARASARFRPSGGDPSDEGGARRDEPGMDFGPRRNASLALLATG